VVIPASVTDIKVGAFGSCKALSSIYCYTTAPVDMSFSGDGFWGVDKTSCLLYVPIGKKAAYKSALYWKDFVNIIEMPTELPTFSAEKLRLYPYPITESFQIQGIEGEFSINIYDTNGRTLINKKVQANENISLSNFTKGLYIIRIFTKEGSIEQKIMKQ
jgi:hypothetical protein